MNISWKKHAEETKTSLDVDASCFSLISGSCFGVETMCCAVLCAFCAKLSDDGASFSLPAIDDDNEDEVFSSLSLPIFIWFATVDGEALCESSGDDGSNGRSEVFPTKLENLPNRTLCKCRRSDLILDSSQERGKFSIPCLKDASEVEEANEKLKALRAFVELFGVL